jgi:hypothetical protein
MTKPRIGEILVNLGYLSPPQLEGALVHQRQWGFGLGRCAVLCGFCTEEQVVKALSRQLGLPCLELDKIELATTFSLLVPERIAVQHCVVPLRTTGPRGEVLVVAMAPPASTISQETVRAVSRKARLQVFVASDEAIQRGIARLYRGAPPVTAPRPQPALSDVKPEGSLLDQLGLTARARDAVAGVGQEHSMPSQEVLRRMVELWASNRALPPPPAQSVKDRAS